jgi:hypothetical protein
MSLRPRPLRVGGVEVPSSLIGDLPDSTALLAEPSRLRLRLAEDGYLYLRGLLDPEDISLARWAIFARLAEVGDHRQKSEPGHSIRLSAEFTQQKSTASTSQSSELE